MSTHLSPSFFLHVSFSPSLPSPLAIYSLATDTHTHTHTHNHLAGGGDGHVPISLGGTAFQGCLHTAAVRWGVRVQGCEEGAQRRGNRDAETGRRGDGSLGALHQFFGVSVAPGQEP